MNKDDASDQDSEKDDEEEQMDCDGF